MRQKAHKRSRMIGTSVAAAMALLLGGGGLVIMNANANAHNANRDGGQQQKRAGQWRAATIDCPEVVNELRDVPRQSRREVDRNLAQLDTQVAEAYKRLKATGRNSDRQFVNNAVLGPLEDKRRATIDRIATSIGRWAERPQGLDRFSECEAVPDENQNQDQDQGQDQGGDNAGQDGGGDQGQEQDQGQDNGGQDGGDQGDGGQQGPGPSPDDFVDITQVEPNVEGARQGEDASTGSFVTECGVNENGKFNSDNVIAAPGVVNAAHHVHDYVGNQDNTALSTNDSLAAGATTCVNQEDQSTYYWPVIRLQNGVDEDDANDLGGGAEGNIGEIQTPASATLSFEGNPRGEVVEMPRFLRIITGDAKAATNGDANANASWSCTGFEDKVQLKDKYPLCPEGSQTVRTFKFQSCWDGQNIDSANHRTHVAFANEDGECEDGFQAIPQMVQRIAYDLPQGETFAVDAFPEQLHAPITDHSDFINVMSDGLNADVVDCINNGEKCVNNRGADNGDGGDNQGDDQGDNSGDSGDGQDQSSDAEQPSDKETAPSAPQQEQPQEQEQPKTTPNKPKAAPVQEDEAPSEPKSTQDKPKAAPDEPEPEAKPEAEPEAEVEAPAPKAKAKPKAEKPAAPAAEAPEPVNQPAGDPAPDAADAPDAAPPADAPDAAGDTGALPQDESSNEDPFVAGAPAPNAAQPAGGTTEAGGSGNLPMIAGAVVLGLVMGVGLMFMNRRRSESHSGRD